MPEAFDAYYKWLGIPSEEQPPDRYRLLGIRMFEPDPDVISNAADQRMAHIRSFQAGGHSAARAISARKFRRAIFGEIGSSAAPRPMTSFIHKRLPGGLVCGSGGYGC